MSYEEDFAAENFTQYQGCVRCKKSHHTSSFCRCGRCYYEGKFSQDPRGMGPDIVKCPCGSINIWD